MYQDAAFYSTPESDHYMLMEIYPLFNTSMPDIETAITCYLLTVPIIMDNYPQPQEDAYMNIRYLALVFTLIVVDAIAGDSTLDAAIGGAIGGGTGAALGNEVGGRDGAIIGGALGGAVGAAVATDDEPRHNSTHENTYYRNEYHLHEDNGSHFCPPGQAKKGHC
jgi:outer membrane lipoprotein SlyB